MNKQASVILIILLMIVTACLVAISLKEEQLVQDVAQNNTIMEKTNIITNNEKENSIKKQSNENIIDKNTNYSTNTIKVSEEDKEAIEEYINIICNRSRYLKIPEFKNINNADKEWIYSHIDRNKYITYATEQEINDNLKSIFGNNLEINVKEDQKLISPTILSSIPKYDNTNDKYFLPAFGMDYRILYTINSIKKETNNYIVNVIEYCEQRDYEKNSDDYLAICTCDENEPKKWKKIFEKEENQSGTDKIITDKVLERKEEFQSYNITLIKEGNNKFYVKSINRE